MQTSDNKIRNYSKVLENKYGKKGSVERNQFDEEAYSFYTSQILIDARKQAKITQVELAKRVGVDKSYISRIEHGLIMPTISVFYKIIAALGFRIEIVK